MLAVGGAEAILVLVRLVESGLGKEPPVVPFLQLDRAGSAGLRLPEHFFRRLEIALVVMPDLGNDVHGAVIVDDLPSQLQFTRHRPVLLVEV